MPEELTRYWIRFDWRALSTAGAFEVNAAFYDLLAGVGVTAHDLDDAFELVKHRAELDPLPPIDEVVAGVDPAALSVAGPIGDTGRRGIWYPGP